MTSLRFALSTSRRAGWNSLLQEGMDAGAAGRILLPATEGNGVTGYVAAVGKSYLCADTRLDPLYLPGSPGRAAR